MSKDPSDSKKTVDLLSNDTTFGHAADFEKNLPDGKQAAEDLEVAKQVVEGVEGYFFREKLKEIHKKLFENSTEEH
jgi:hypothetical protein